MMHGQKYIKLKKQCSGAVTCKFDNISLVSIILREFISYMTHCSWRRPLVYVLT